jgi:hypothetical protein
MTNFRNKKIDNFPGVASPRGTFFVLIMFLYEASLGRIG